MCAALRDAGDTVGELDPPDKGKFVQIDAGAFHTCAINIDGVLGCWGETDYDLDEVPEGSFVQVSSGHQHSCVVNTLGTVECWGQNSSGQTDVPIELAPP